MSLIVLLSIGAALLAAGYFLYGSFIARFLSVYSNEKTPANVYADGSDFVPTGKWYLLGQHLSAIAAAGPIVGPVLAGMMFGWVPCVLWILVGGIFIGSVHDMTALVSSLRHKGRSIAEVIKENLSGRAYILFLLFLWFSLIYIITAFSDITASTFAQASAGPSVASSSFMYLLLALVMGVCMRFLRFPLWAFTLIFMPLVFACIWLGRLAPIRLPVADVNVKTAWNIVLLVYCFFASVVPVWSLLQPRGYLGGFFLAASSVAALAGIVAGSAGGSFTVSFPAFSQSSSAPPMFPLLFTTIACGACSGFHAIVSSGTTSKQINRISDSKIIGFGGMLLESFVALIALSTLLILSAPEASAMKDPAAVYANGISLFLSKLGIDRSLALNFALLAFATFVYDTLDVATRLGRFIFQELSGMKGKYSAWLASAVTLALPLIFVTRTATDASGMPIPAWKAFWNVFGTSNQLLAALVLLSVTVWLRRERKPMAYTLIPALFMTAVAVVSLVMMIGPWLASLLSGVFSFDPLIITALTLLLLAILLFADSSRILFAKPLSTVKTEEIPL